LDHSLSTALHWIRISRSRRGLLDNLPGTEAGEDDGVVLDDVDAEYVEEDGAGDDSAVIDM